MQRPAFQVADTADSTLHAVYAYSDARMRAAGADPQELWRFSLPDGHPLKRRRLAEISDDVDVLEAAALDVHEANVAVQQRFFELTDRLLMPVADPLTGGGKFVRIGPDGTGVLLREAVFTLDPAVAADLANVATSDPAQLLSFAAENPEVFLLAIEDNNQIMRRLIDASPDTFLALIEQSPEALLVMVETDLTRLTSEVRQAENSQILIFIADEAPEVMVLLADQDDRLLRSLALADPAVFLELMAEDGAVAAELAAVVQSMPNGRRNQLRSLSPTIAAAVDTLMAL